MKKTVVYGATNNIFLNLIPCLNSLLLNGNIDEVIILTEEDVLPFAQIMTSHNVKALNVSGQKWFEKGSKNTNRRWTYMSLMRITLSKLLPEYDKVLWLDCDTIVEHDISELWDIDLTGYYFGAVKQFSDGRLGQFLKGDYFNAGVLLCNLEKLRDGMDDKIISALQEKEYEFLEQDCLNELCAGKIKPIAGRYNVSNYTVKDEEKYILHFAAQHEWLNSNIARKYKEVQP